MTKPLRVLNCPELEICQAISDGSTHMASLDNEKTQIAEPDPNERGTDRQLVARIETVDGGGTRDAIEVLAVVVDFWAYQAINETVFR